MMELPGILRKEIIEFFKSLPVTQDSESQQAFIYSVGLDQQLQDLISFGKPAAEFASLLLSKLLQYGSLNDGRHSLEAVLEATQNYIGQDKRVHRDLLIKKLQNCGMKRVPEYSHQTLDTQAGQHVRRSPHFRYYDTVIFQQKSHDTITIKAGGECSSDDGERYYIIDADRDISLTTDLDTETNATSILYYIWVGEEDGLMTFKFSLSSQAPTGLSYPHRLKASVYRNFQGTILPFLWDGHCYTYTCPVTCDGYGETELLDAGGGQYGCQSILRILFPQMFLLLLLPALVLKDTHDMHESILMIKMAM